ncbi:MAG: ribbon-helix-helix protein, CopG family [Pseudonocardia sp.]
MASDRDQETATDAEVAGRQYDDHADGELSDEEGEPVEFEVARPLLATMSFRVPREEADAIRVAANEAEISQSEWIRAAARLAINNDKPVQPTIPSATAGKLQAIKDLVDAVLTDTETPTLGGSARAAS